MAGLPIGGDIRHAPLPRRLSNRQSTIAFKQLRSAGQRGLGCLRMPHSEGNGCTDVATSECYDISRGDDGLTAASDNR